MALAPTLRRLSALEVLDLGDNLLGDEGLAALVAPPPPAGALPPTTGVLMKLKTLYLNQTQITDAGCAALASALASGALLRASKKERARRCAKLARHPFYIPFALPALERVYLEGIPASAAAKAAVRRAGLRSDCCCGVIFHA